MSKESIVKSIHHRLSALSKILFIPREDIYMNVSEFHRSVPLYKVLNAKSLPGLLRHGSLNIGRSQCGISVGKAVSIESSYRRSICALAPENGVNDNGISVVHDS